MTTKTRKVLVRQNQLDYLGIFGKPAFPLWGAGGRILEGLFEAFQGLHRGLRDITAEETSDSPANQSVVVNIGPLGLYRFRFDRVEATMYNFGDSDLNALPQALDRGQSWLRSAIPAFAFQTHVFTYGSHSELEGATSEQFLQNLSNVQLAGMGRNLGSGIIYHADLPEAGWRVQLTIDHSLAVANGLYMHFVVVTSTDVIRYGEILKRGRQTLEAALHSIGLQLSGEQ